MSTKSMKTLALAWLVMYLILLEYVDGHVLLFDTENGNSVENYDCVYNRDPDGSLIKYCKRLRTPNLLHRSSDICYNEGERWNFSTMLELSLTPDTVLQWSSSIEIVELYARLFYGNETADDESEYFACNCTRVGTFGKYCEYQLIDNNVDETSFSSSIRMQFNNRKGNEDWLQVFGSIICYETLTCEFGLMCLEWRNICDGKQNCLDGKDEESCDLLEFNECERDEYRCDNGMCIPEEYWLDGEFDCMDLSDERTFTRGLECPKKFDTFRCDERLCYASMVSCGDGQCVMLVYLWDHSTSTDWACVNMRERNYFCEITTAKQLWTMPNGMCYPFPDYNDTNDLNQLNLSRAQKCIYLVKCALSRGFERDCPCSQSNCSTLIREFCDGDFILYPTGARYAPHLHFRYKIKRDWHSIIPDSTAMDGCVKCRGCRKCHSISTEMTFYKALIRATDAVACIRPAYVDTTSPIQYDANCWNDSRTFNGHSYAIADVCSVSEECISRYRLLDRTANCADAKDEQVIDYQCDVNIRRHRFHCSSENQTACLAVWRLGNSEQDCHNNFDEYLYGLDIPIKDIHCVQSNDASCRILRQYISESSWVNQSQSLSTLFDRQPSTNQVPFHYLCNTYWDFPTKMDESTKYCSQWICSANEFQCRSGQCMLMDYVCDGEIDCNDGSDEQGIFLIIGENMSQHNRQLKNLSAKIEQCHQLYDHQQPFAKFCNFQRQFPCLLNNVPDPLDLWTNRPCINLTQIGDGVADCFGALDEMNTFESCIRQMKGFGFRCKDKLTLWTCISYYFLCDVRCKARDDEPLCFYRSNMTNCSAPQDVLCLDGKQCAKGGRCNGELECPYGEDEFWCSRMKSDFDKANYRQEKHVNEIDREHDFRIPSYPTLRPLQSGPDVIKTNQTGIKSESVLRDSFWCNRGVSIRRNNTLECLCPPPYYGDRCQYYSDRITVITDFRSDHPIDNNSIIKILATLRHEHNTIDFHEFHVQPALLMGVPVKHRFHLLYSRRQFYLQEKQERQLSRERILHEHPYSIRFEAFELRDNDLIIELGAWHYPIYFDFLPSFRLATILRLPKDYINISIEACRKHRCQRNSICRPLFSNEHSYYCSCEQGYYGKYCQYYFDQCYVFCSAQSLCKVKYHDETLGGQRPLCICPRDRFGSRCYLRFDSFCPKDRCQNNGICLYTYDWTGETRFRCVCPDRFYGDQCEYEKVSVDLRLNASEQVLATLVQFFDIDRRSFQLEIRHQEVQLGLPTLIRYDHRETAAPPLCVLKFYDDVHSDRYSIGYFQPSINAINITSKPWHCPPAEIYLQQLNISKSFSILNVNDDIPSMFFYHHICRQWINATDRPEFICFHGENYLCTCESDFTRSSCFMLDPTLDQCSKCLSDGRCVQGHLTDPSDFVCLCPNCHYGRVCEFNNEAFSVTLDSLIIQGSTAAQTIYIVLLAVFGLVGLFNNICSLITFRRQLPRKYGVGYYLLFVSILNQISLLFLFIKLLTIRLTSINLVHVMSCKIISYFLSVSTRSIYWLMTWISMARLSVIIVPHSSLMNRPRTAIAISFVTLLSVLVLHLHEFMYLRVVEPSLLCTMVFPSSAISTYHRLSVTLHHLIPFSMQTICITLLIIFLARNRTKTNGLRNEFEEILKKQLFAQKELYISPGLAIFAALPQTILCFYLACSSMNTWQRHLLTITYLFCYVPHVLGFLLHVLPSSAYKKEFLSTSIGKMAFFQRGLLSTSVQHE